MYLDTKEEQAFVTPVEITPVEPWRKLLLDAADILDQKGWVQGKSVDLETGHICMEQAVAKLREVAAA